MSNQVVNIGAAPDDGTGDPLRTAFNKINGNSSELYTFLGDGSALLPDPGADRLLYWDERANILKWLTVGDNLTITDTTIAATVVTDHGALTGLTDDDHAQYVLADGSRDISNYIKINDASTRAGVLHVGDSATAQTSLVYITSDDANVPHLRLVNETAGTSVGSELFVNDAGFTIINSLAAEDDIVIQGGDGNAIGRFYYNSEASKALVLGNTASDITTRTRLYVYDLNSSDDTDTHNTAYINTVYSVDTGVSTSTIGCYSLVQGLGGAGNSTTLTGFRTLVFDGGYGASYTYIRGVHIEADAYDSFLGNTVFNLVGVDIDVYADEGIVGTKFGIRVDNSGYPGTTATHGIYVDNFDEDATEPVSQINAVGTAISYFGGPVGFGVGTISSGDGGAWVQAKASTTSQASLYIPHGTAPSSPYDGDVWTTTTSMYVRINGSTIDLAGAGSPGGSNTEIQYNNSGAFGGVSGLTWSGSVLTLTGASVFSAGSASADTWPKLTAGTVQTTPSVGSIELDSNCVYLTTDAGNRGYVPVVHMRRMDATRTLTSTTNTQALFDSPTTITLEVGTYRYFCIIYLSGMSGTSGNFRFAISNGGTATLADGLSFGTGRDVAQNAAGSTMTGSYWTSTGIAPTTNLLTAATTTAAGAIIEGTFTVTVAGTIIPSVALTTAAAATVNIGTTFECWRIGSTSVTSVGQWS